MLSHNLNACSAPTGSRQSIISLYSKIQRSIIADTDAGADVLRLRDIQVLNCQINSHTIADENTICGGSCQSLSVKITDIFRINDI